MSSGASVSALQRLVEQLKLEAGVERIKVSQAAAELQQYCMQNACKDALLVGVPAGSNPFREPRSCALLAQDTPPAPALLLRGGWSRDPTHRAMQNHMDRSMLCSRLLVNLISQEHSWLL